MLGWLRKRGSASAAPRVRRLRLDEDCDPLYWGQHKPVVIHDLGYNCDLCGEAIDAAATRYYCAQCDEDQVSFDLCEACHSQHDAGHALVALRPSHWRPLSAWPSVALGLRDRFLCYRERRLLAPDALSPSLASEWLTYADVYCAARSLATRLHALLPSATAATAVAIAAANSVRWCVADFALHFLGVVVAPIPASMTLEQTARALARSGSRLVFVDGDRAALLASDAWPDGVGWSVAEVVTMHGGRAEASELQSALAARGRRARVTPWETAAASVAVSGWLPVRSRGPSDLATILFTSGTTGGGEPRAVAVQELVLADEFRSPPPPFFSSCVQLAYLPLSYSAQRLLLLGVINDGGRAALFGGSGLALFDALRRVQPTFVQAPPRVWTSLREQCDAEAAAAERDTPEDRRAQARERVLRECERSFGPRLREISTGSAQVPEGLVEWMRACFRKATVTEGYGTTEAGSIARNGLLRGDVEVRLEDVPELGYSGGDRPFPRGLLWVRTRHVTLGYYGDRESTSEAFEGGFSCTGDILSQGCYVSPERLEVAFCKSSLISSAFVYGEGEFDQVVAAVVPREQELRRALEAAGVPLPASSAELCASGESEGLVLSQMRAIAQEQGFQPFEVPRAVLLDAAHWTAEDGLLTSSLKANRAALTRKYRDRLRALYHGHRAPQQPSPPTGAQTPTLSGGGTDPVAAPLPAASREEERMLEAVQDAAVESFGSRPDSDTPLRSIGFDSLSALKLVEKLRSRIRVRVNVAALYRPTATARSLAQEMCAAVSQSRASLAELLGPPAVDWELEGMLHPQISALLLAQRKGSRAEGVLITGATGLVGAHVLAEAVRAWPKRACRFFCLCRGDPARLREALGRRHVLLDDDRVVPVAGDVCELRLGLGDALWGRLADEVGVVLHCAAHVSAALPYSELRGPNVNGTMEVLRLAASGRPKRLVHVSSVSAFHPVEFASGSAPECGRLPLRLCEGLSGYGASKRVAEALVWEAVEACGMDGIVVRLGTVGGHSRTGSCGPGDLTSRFLMAVDALGTAPDAPGLALSMAPVDWVTRVLVGVALEGTSAEGAYHVVDPREHCATLEAAVQALRMAGRSVETVGEEQWRRSLAGTPLEPLAALFERRMPFDGTPEVALFDHQRTAELCTRCSIEFPAVSDQSYILQMIQFCREWGSE
eukprot:m51a1_g4349 hypothetical protein (1179) ;mRNA; f:209686-213405